jgi:hypothetical protein
MQGHWERRQIRQAVTGTLLFTPEQAKLIQAEAQTRMRFIERRSRASFRQRRPIVHASVHLASKQAIFRVFSATQPHKGNRIIESYGAGDGNRTHVRSLGSLL